jgi:hypothetical protein
VKFLLSWLKIKSMYSISVQAANIPTEKSNHGEGKVRCSDEKWMALFREVN